MSDLSEPRFSHAAFDFKGGRCLKKQKQDELRIVRGMVCAVYDKLAGAAGLERAAQELRRILAGLSVD